MYKRLAQSLTPALLLCGASLACQAAEEKPNIIFVLADDLGFGDVGFNGQEKIKTPNLDRMAMDGAVMTNFYAGAPVCGPSRACLMYGLHTGHCPIRGNPAWTKSGKAPELAPDATLLPKEMKRAGYATALFGKWGLNENLKSNVGNPLKQGFDEFVGFNTHMEAHYHWPDYYWDGNKKVDLSGGKKKGNWLNKTKYADDIFTERTLDFIDRKAGKKPFFIYLCYTIPHKGYTVPADSRKPYESMSWPKKPMKSGHYNMDPELHSAYAGMVSHMDNYLGQIQAKLEEKGIAENTLVFFTSDNGHEISSNFFESGGLFRGKKRNVTEGGIHMPTVVTWPAVIKPGSRITTPFAFWDVMATFCDIAGIKPKAKTDGISFLPSLKNEYAKQKQHEAFYWEFNEMAGPRQAVRFGHWKAIKQWDKSKNAMGPVQIYDLSADIGEASNLAKEHPELVEKARKYFAEMRQDNPEFPLELHRKAMKKGKSGKKGKNARK